MIVSVCGTVVMGKQLGRTLGFPTANIETGCQYELPRNGVYAARVYLDDRPKAYDAILNQGTHPTAPEGPPTIEAHLLDFSEDIYGARIRADYVEFIRAERKFSSLDELKAQIARDELTAREIFEKIAGKAATDS